MCFRSECNCDGDVSSIDRKFSLYGELQHDREVDEGEMRSLFGSHPSSAVPLVNDICRCSFPRLRCDGDGDFPAAEGRFVDFCDDFVIPGVEFLVKGV